MTLKQQPARNPDKMVMMADSRKIRPRTGHRYSEKNACDRCRYKNACPERWRLGLWVHCEMPDRYDIKLSVNRFNERAMEPYVQLS